MSIDLVCGMIVDDQSAPAKTTLEGVNYYFCAEYCKEAFEREPEKFLEGTRQWGTAIDPVCGMSVEIPNAAAMSVYNGRFIYFCNEACKERFNAATFLKTEEINTRKGCRSLKHLTRN